MRIGVVPTRARPSSFSPAEVQVVVVVHIPSREGYFVHRLEILELCFKSIERNTTEPFDFVVFDNGSTPEVVDYLRSLQERGLIDCLILSTENIGKVAALQYLSRALPGKYLAYSDDDILFEEGWLEAHLAVLDAFPSAGLVSGWPLRANLSRTALVDQLVEQGLVRLEATESIPQEWEAEFATSTGRQVERHLQDIAGLPEFTLHAEEGSAYLSASHFQFVARREQFAEAVGSQLSERLTDDDGLVIDDGLDKAGFLRLATTQKFVRHMGNVLTDELVQLAQSWELDAPVRKVPPERFLEKIAATPRGRAILSRVYHRLFWALSHTARTGPARRKDR